MSVLTINGQQWVVGLEWIQGTSARRLARAARAEETPYVVVLSEESAVVPADDGDPSDMPSLAAALQRAIEEPNWTAAVEDDEKGQIAIVRVEDGLIAAGGEEVLQDREIAHEALRNASGPVFATAGLRIEGARIITSAMLTDVPEIRVELLPDTSVPWGLITKAAVAVTLVAGGIAGWMMRDEIMELIYGPPPAPAQVQEETKVKVAFDGTALVDACARALEVKPAGLAGWELTEILCEAEFGNRDVVAQARQMRGRSGVMLKWVLTPGHDAAVHRRLMSDHVAAWAFGQVDAKTAWAFMPLQPVLVEWDGPAKPEFAALRAAVDRNAGPWAESLAYKRDRNGNWSITMEGPGPIARLDEALARIDGIEILRIRRAGAGVWRVEARTTVTRTIGESAFIRITTPMFPEWYEPRERDDV